MDPAAFRWLRRPGHAPAALLAPDARVPAPLAAEPLDGAVLAWIPLPAPREALAAIVKLPEDALRLFPARAADVPRVLDAWLRLYDEAREGMEEAVLQVHDDSAHLRDYLAAERALWGPIYEAHPHTEESEGLYPHNLDEAAWLLDRVLSDDAFEDEEGFLTQAAFGAIARELLLTVRRAEMVHLRDHLRGQDTVMGW